MLAVIMGGKQMVNAGIGGKAYLGQQGTVKRGIQLLCQAPHDVFLVGNERDDAPQHEVEEKS